MATFSKKGIRKKVSDENKKMVLELRKRGIIDNTKKVVIEEVKANRLFDEIVSVFNTTFTLGCVTGCIEDINSIVTTDVCTITKSKSFMISIRNSWLRLTPNKEGGICLSRLQIDSRYRGLGIGTLLMNSFLLIFKDALKNILIEDNNYDMPIINLEVLDCVGYGKNKSIIDVDKTASFYNSFGFEIIESSLKYRKMELDIVRAIEISSDFEKSLFKGFTD